MMETVVPILERLQGAGFGTLLALILFGSYKGWWVWGRDYRKLEHERDGWRDLALRGTSLAEGIVSLHTTTKGVS